MVSLKAVQPLRPLLSATVAEIEAAPAALPPGSLAAGGAGVVLLQRADAADAVQAVQKLVGGP